MGGGGAVRVTEADVPLRTQGRYIIGQRGERVKWACVNWYGAHSETHVPGGLEVQPMGSIIDKIVELGFNCVRLCYSTQAQVENPLVFDRHVKANPEFFGKRFFDVWDAVVAALSGAGLMVIPNNHNHKSGWCCHYTQDEGLWYVPGYPESLWIEGLVNMTRRYRTNRMVVAMDLRNEIHDYQSTVLTWGDGNEKTDWAAAATRAGNAVLAENPELLIVVNGLCFGMDIRAARDFPIQLSLPRRVVYEAHNYLEFNIFNVFSEVIMPWYDVQWITGSLGTGCVATIYVLLRGWRAVGKPRPSVEVLITSGAFWVSGMFMIALVCCQIIGNLIGRIPACGYWVRRDVIPWSWLLGCTAGACLVIGILADVHRVYPRFAASTRCLKPSRSATACVGPEGAAAEESELEAEDTEDSAEPEDFRRALQGNSARTRRCAPGLASWRLARSRCCGRSKVPEEDLPPAEWDLGLCLGLQLFLLCSLLLIACALMFAFATIAPSYAMLAWHLDNSWGYLLREGYDYTAPVWMGEFGSTVPGHYWNNFVQYLNDRDVDFAYWAINGRKWSSGYIDTQRSGVWIAEKPHWGDEWFGLLKADYKTVRTAWMMLDLRSLESSPASWRPRQAPCDRRAMGTACGG